MGLHRTASVELGSEYVLALRKKNQTRSLLALIDSQLKENTVSIVILCSDVVPYQFDADPDP